MGGGTAGRGARVAIGVGTALTIVGIVLAAMATPVYMHAALDASGSAGILGLDRATTHAVSDRTVGEILTGPGTFAFSATPGGPRFYDEREAGHLWDVRLLVYAFIVMVALGAIGLAVAFVPRRRDPAAWRAMRIGTAVLAAGFAAVGLFFTVAFDSAFTLFHEILFPEGNWSFDTATERMVQLYPTPFWQLFFMTLALGTLVLCGLAWVVATSRARSLERGMAHAVPAGMSRVTSEPAGTPAGQSPETPR